MTRGPKQRWPLLSRSRAERIARSRAQALAAELVELTPALSDRGLFEVQNAVLEELRTQLASRGTATRRRTP